MQALSIKQPWIHAILFEGKDIENRTWQRSFRGWLALHASSQPNREAVFPRGIRVPELSTLDYSSICGVARVVDIVPKSRSKWFWRPDDGSTNLRLAPCRCYASKESNNLQWRTRPMEGSTEYLPRNSTPTPKTQI